MKTPKPLHLFLLCFFVSVSIMGVFDLPYIGQKLQAAELLFPILIFWVWREIGLKEMITSFKKPLSILLLIFGALNFIPNLFHGSFMPILRELGNVYLCILTILLLALFAYIPRSRIITIYIRAAVVVALIAIIGWLSCYSSGQGNYTVLLFKDYPLLGDVYRARGLSMGGSSLFLYLLPPFFLSLSIALKGRDKTHWLFTGILFLGAFFTFSKSLILLLAGSLWIFLDKKGYSSFIKKIVLIGGAGSFLFLTHLLPVFFNETYQRKEPNSIYYAEDIIEINPYFGFEPTCYITMKKAGIEGIKSAPWLGIGSGNAESFTETLKIKGDYPSFLVSYSPHSVPIRSWEENGILGFLGILLLYGCTLVFLVKNWTVLRGDSILSAFAVGVLLTMVESLALDLISYRFVWVNMAVFLSYFYSISQDSKEYSFPTQKNEEGECLEILAPIKSLSFYCKKTG